MLLPFIRFNRALASTLIYPEHPIKAIAISESISVIGPLLNPNMYKKIIGLMLAMMYMPNFASAIINIHNKNKIIYYQSEICPLMLFILTIFVNNCL